MTEAKGPATVWAGLKEAEMSIRRILSGVGAVVIALGLGACRDVMGPEETVLPQVTVQQAELKPECMLVDRSEASPGEIKKLEEHDEKWGCLP